MANHINGLRILLICFAFICIPLSALSQNLSREIAVNRLVQNGLIDPSLVVSDESNQTKKLIKVALTGQQPETKVLFTFKQPGIQSPMYAIAGRIKYEGISEKGYLEFVSEFADGNSYFTKSLDEQGPAKVLQGASDWYDFRLGFIARAGQLPTAVSLGVMLPQGGTVYLDDLSITEIRPTSSHRKPWFKEKDAAWLGTIGGLVLGILGAYIGTVLAKRKSKRSTILWLVAIDTCSTLVLISGIYAYSLSQPYHVYYPLILIGAIGSLISTILLLGVIKKK